MKPNSDPSARLRNIDLNLLKVFNAVLSQRNISQAANVLSVSQPAVSNALRRLRELYDDPLFVRSASGMIPTPRAQELSAPILRALIDIEKTVGAHDQFQPATSQRVMNVSLTDYGEHYFLPKMVQEFTRIAPGMELICHPASGATLTLEMKSGSIDLVWDWVRINDPDYFVETIFEDSGCCLVRKNHPLIDGQLSLETFLEAEHVALRPTQQHIPRVERALDKIGRARKVVAQVSHIVVLPEIVANTDLVASIPKRLARKYAAMLDLQVLPSPVYDDSVPVYQMWHRHFEDDEGHKWLRNLTKEIAESF